MPPMHGSRCLAAIPAVARGATATLRSRMNTKILLVSLALAVAAVSAAAASGVPTVCIAPTLESDAKKPLPEVDSLEFYFDEGDVRSSYSVAFHRVESATVGGRVQNSYRVGDALAIGATIEFASTPPLPTSFIVVPINRVIVTTGPNTEETAFMADAVPGIACGWASVRPIMQR